VSTKPFCAGVPTCDRSWLTEMKESTRKRCVETLEYWKRHGARPLTLRRLCGSVSAENIIGLQTTQTRETENALYAVS